MESRIHRLFRLRVGEAGLVFTLGLLLFANSLALVVADVVAVSGFLSEVSASNILIVWAVDMALIILMTGAQSLIVDRWDRIRLMGGMIFVFALVYVLLRLMFAFHVPGWFNYSFLYLLSDQQWLFFPLVLWILANDIFDMAQAKRLFPLMAALGFLGQIVGLGLASAAPSLFARWNISSVELLSLNVLIYLLAFAIFALGLSRVRIRQTSHKSETVRETLTEGWGFIKEVPSFRYLTLAMLAVGLALTIVEYHFLYISVNTFTNPDSFQTFYGLYRLGVTVVAILVQSLLTSRLIEKINLKNTFLILPVVMTACTGWIIALPGIISAAGGRGLARLIYMTIDESARKAFQALVPEERRGRVSIFWESYLPAAGTILGSVIAWVIVFLGTQLNGSYYTIVYLGIALVTSALSIWAVLKMRAVYESSLWNWRLKRRQRRSDVMDRLDF